jgi:ABC-type Na+ efflux pump permease subunit
MLAATLARSLREAQLRLGLLQSLIVLPLMSASFINFAPKLPLMTIPGLSQHLLITQLLRGEGVDLTWLATSASATLLLSAIAILTVARLYRRESLLG